MISHDTMAGAQVTAAVADGEIVGQSADQHDSPSEPKQDSHDSNRSSKQDQYSHVRDSRHNKYSSHFRKLPGTQLREFNYRGSGIKTKCISCGYGYNNVMDESYVCNRCPGLVCTYCIGDGHHARHHSYLKGPATLEDIAKAGR